ncbi:hypothetical protein HJC23_002826 [Cyclotella cryptica]|uniref:Uncharacterized protein n=1 Tax=Cyclotella cryptica TaxID=29204 RepID=A0ABD3PPG0_9STRA|eukprot:CCRYP_013106-RA/>CCRYP_013106-RA protein AED:0.06 eAED:0.06 QI:154/1/1/1/1/1/3/70/523
MNHYRAMISLASIFLLMRMGSGAFTSVAFAPPLQSSNCCQEADDAHLRQQRRGVRAKCQELRYRSQLGPSGQRLSVSIPLFATPTSKQLARQLYEENLMPPTEDDIIDSHESNQEHEVQPTHIHGRYDENEMTPLESEFRSLMSTFLTYSERDIRSLTSTSNRYVNYINQQQIQKRNSLSEPHQHRQTQKTHKAQKRTKEAGIRYRALFDGVQSGALEPAVLRSFSVLFEDYLPIRLAGRRIYKYLGSVMDEVRLERQGEIARAQEICISSASNVVDGANVDIEYAHDVWDTLVDESMLTEDSLNTNDTKGQPQEVGVLSLSQLMHLGVDVVLIDMNLVKDHNDFLTRFKCAVSQEDAYTGHTQENTENLEMTFVSFVRMLYGSWPSIDAQNETKPSGMSAALLQRLERLALDSRQCRVNGKDTSAALASKAIHSGSNVTCKKRQRNSDRFDEYVAAFKVWEDKFVGGHTTDHPSRRLDILRGCFSGARDARVVAALKIVYMDYAALRLAGDLIFKLMSKIAG